MLRVQERNSDMKTTGEEGENCIESKSESREWILFLFYEYYFLHFTHSLGFHVVEGLYVDELHMENVWFWYPFARNSLSLFLIRVDFYRFLNTGKHNNTTQFTGFLVFLRWMRRPHKCNPRAERALHFYYVINTVFSFRLSMRGARKVLYTPWAQLVCREKFLRRCLKLNLCSVSFHHRV